jgi:hypothetical protein
MAPPDHPAGLFPRLCVVGGAGEQMARLDGGRRHATLIESGADRRGISLGDDSLEGARWKRYV